MTTRSYYDVLRVPRFASRDIIASAYRHLARVWHSDRNPNHTVVCDEEFKIILRAYETLHDEARRRTYD